VFSVSHRVVQFSTITETCLKLVFIKWMCFNGEFILVEIPSPKMKLAGPGDPATGHLKTEVKPTSETSWF
jgi:hypothetical protein